MSNTKTPIPLLVLAEQVSKLEVDQEIHFTIHPDRDLYGITRQRKFDTEYIYLSYFNGGNMSVYDPIFGEDTPTELLPWIAEVIELDPDAEVYLVKEPHYPANHKNNFDFQEALADITYTAGFYRLRIDGNSRTVIDTVIQWTKEFQQQHKGTDWCEVEYLDTIELFTEEKISQHMLPLHCSCPDCEEESLRYEIIQEPHQKDQYRLVCRACGKVTENGRTKEFLLEFLFNTYQNTLREHGKEEYDIQQYLTEELHLSEGEISEEDLLTDFQQWKEQSDLAFQKIQDINYYSQL